jgi:hypothetical protein
MRTEQTDSSPTSQTMRRLWYVVQRKNGSALFKKKNSSDVCPESVLANSILHSYRISTKKACLCDPLLQGWKELVTAVAQRYIERYGVAAVRCDTRILRIA